MSDLRDEGPLEFAHGLDDPREEGEAKPAKKNGARLSVAWSKRKKDFVIRYPAKPDGHWVHYLFSHQVYDSEARVFQSSFLEELESRGYDTTTLRFQVDLRDVKVAQGKD